ncbi:MAG: 4a-hydroxytetrahydrobiopterin dehydratase [Mariprofundaceae bacterium]
MRGANQGLSARRCVPCKGGVAPMTPAEAEAMLFDTPGWALVDEATRLRRSFRFDDFMQAQDFAVRVGELAEREGHHPDICYGWGWCTVVFYTHKIGGLHENDFIMAAKVNALTERA